MKRKISFFLLTLFYLNAFEICSEEEISYRKIASEISFYNIKKHISFFSSFSSRMPGTEGIEKSSKYIVEKLKNYNLKPKVEKFNVTVPVQLFAFLRNTNTGEKYELHAVWPNLVRTSTIIEKNKKFPILFVKKGMLFDFNGKTVEDKIVIMDFDGDWQNAARLGAKAVIFIEPDEMSRFDAENKFSNVPLSLPRFIISQKDAKTLINECQNDLFEISAKIVWKDVETSNIYAFIKGSDKNLKNEVIGIETYYDSNSIIPSIAPGAESSSSISSLLELIRFLNKYPPKRTVLILITSAHFQGIAGMRHFLFKHFSEFEKRKINLTLFISIDLSSHNDAFGIFHRSNFYELESKLDTRYSSVASYFKRRSRIFAQQLNRKEEIFVDGINQGWDQFVPFQYAGDFEAVSIAGGPGIGFVTIDDFCNFIDTPHDTLEKVNVKNIFLQTQLLASLIYDACNRTDVKFPENCSFTRQGITNGYAELVGKVVKYDVMRGDTFIPNDPILDSIAVAKFKSPNYRSMKGVRGVLIQKVDKNGEFSFPGLPPVNATMHKRDVHIEAYKLDEKTGEIIYAPDLGAINKQFPTKVFILGARMEVRIIVFKCVKTDIYDLASASSLKFLPSVNVLEALSNSEPITYGYTLERTDEGDWVGSIFTDSETGIKITAGGGLTPVGLILTGSKSPEDKEFEGRGIDVKKGGTIIYMPVLVLKDLWNLNEGRIRKFKKHKITNENVNRLHKISKIYLTKSLQELTKKNYHLAFVLARIGWGYETQLYPEVRKMANDAVKGVIFYLALMMPFAYFLERLLLGFRNLQYRILAVGIIFILLFTIFRFVHPAFDIAINPIFILLSFVILCLSILVIFLVSGKFEEQIRKIHAHSEVIHKAEIQKTSIFSIALTLGLSNMRKRKVRTILTSATLILLTFTLLSFTSVISGLKVNSILSEGKAPYQGIMVRDGSWQFLLSSTEKYIIDEFLQNHKITKRTYYYSDEKNEGSYIPLRLRNNRYNLRAVLGLHYNDKFFLNTEKTLIVGRWFEENERNVCIIPDKVAKFLKISKRKIINGLSAIDKLPVVSFSGLYYKVIGIYDSKLFDELKELDGEPITPVDFVFMEKTKQIGGQENLAFKEYKHIPSSEIIVVSNLDGVSPRSISILFDNGKTVKRTMEDLMHRWDFNIYAGIDGKLYRFSAATRSSITGLKDLLIPIIIASLIVLNTMLGAVFERQGEIATFSSLGLAPSHIAGLFLAESAVYSVLGAVAGYLIAQGVAKFVTAFNLLPGLSLNYSSLSALSTTGIVIIIVMLSTIYPARKASQVATPAIDRVWKLPEPEGDNWMIKLPFTVATAQAKALSRFIEEWFLSYGEYSIGDIITENTRLSTSDSKYGIEYSIKSDIWLAPFDLGVSQYTRISIIPTEIDNVSEIGLKLIRKTGDLTSWKRLNRRFITNLRKQFLIWRTLSESQKEKYLT